MCEMEIVSPIISANTVIEHGRVVQQRCERIEQY